MELAYYKQSKTIAMLFFQGQKSEQEQQQTYNIFFNLPEGVVIFKKTCKTLMF
jgi:hypothetical protein